MDRNNRNYGGQSSANALRNSRSPPRHDSYGRNGSQGRNLSPLRSQAAKSSSIQAQPHREEEMYERARQGELRRQIEEKELELQTVSSKHQERMNRNQNGGDSQYGSLNASQVPVYPQRSGSASGQFQPSVAQPSSAYKRSSNSPLRAREGSQGAGGYQSTSFVARSGSGSRYQPQVETATRGSAQQQRGPAQRLAPVYSQRPPIPQIDNYLARQKSPRSPLRQKSRSPTRDVDMRDASYGLSTVNQQRQTISPVRNASNEYLSQLQQDNNSLQKRLNLVLQELDRVNRDRSKLVHKMTQVDQDVNEMQQKLREEDNADKLNNGVQYDVNGQRDNNVNVKRSIADTDYTRQEAISKLRVLQAERDRRTNMADTLKSDLDKKVLLSKQLEQEQYHANEQINELEQKISNLNRTVLQDDEQIADIQRINEKLTNERDDLHDKLEALNRTYDNCVQEITRERAQMQGHNRHHNKLLVAKVTFSLLEHMFKKRKQEAMNEFFQYCKFDSKCHDTLKQFVKTIERLGQFRQRIAIKQWHQRTFKPLEMKVQKSDLCYEFNRKKLLSKMFNQWRMRQLNAHNLYGAKSRALQAIWNAKAKDCGQDVQRAFTIWRDNLNFAKYRHQRVKKLVWKSYSNKLAKAFQKWVGYSQTMQGQVRLHILARTFAETQLKRISFNEMRFALVEMRRKRLNRLRIYVKAWKESNQYKKFLLRANLAVLGFKKDCNRSLLKTCFDALKQSKEEEKFTLMTEALEQDCLPAIESVSKHMEKKTQEAVRSGRKKGLGAIKGMIYRQVAEYFNKWKNVQTREKVMINDRLKDMIIRRWQQSQKDAFDLWKIGKAHQEITMQGGMIMEMQEEGSGLAAEVEELGKKIEIKKKEVDRSGRSALGRGTKIMKKRYLKQYFDKWATINRKNVAQTDGADAIRTKMRKRFLRQAFDLYKAGCARELLSERNEGSCDHLKKTLDSRLARKCFNAIKAFNNKHQTAERYFKVILGKMDHWMKKRAFATWMDGGNAMKMEMHFENQAALTEEMTVKNNELGALTKKVADKNARNVQLTNQLKSMGSKTMSNSFLRAYMKRTQKAFEAWKERNRSDKEKEKIMRKTIMHMLKRSGQGLMVMMISWKTAAGISDSKQAIAQAEYEMTDMALVQKGELTTFEEKKAQLQQETRTVNAEFDKTVTKRSKLLALMTEHNEGNHFQGRLRFLFLQWAAHTKRTKHFTQCAKNVIMKSMWQRGFQNIREFARDKQLTRDQNQGCNKMRKMFWRKNCGAAFSKWRQTEYEQTIEMIVMTQDNTNQMQEEHASRKKVIQKQNITRSARIVGKSAKHKYYIAWKNVTRWLKHKRTSTSDLLQAQSSYAVKRCIKKWRARAAVTIAARAAYDKFQMKRDLMYKRSVFRELMLKHHRDKALVLRLSNAAKKFDSRNLQSAFQMIRNYWIAKENTHNSEKHISARNFRDVLNKVYLRKMLQYQSHLRRQIHGDKVVTKKKRTMFGHLQSQRVRDAFNMWKKKSNFAQTVIEVNEIGPVVEEVLDARLDVCNLKNLMASEGFTQNQIDDVSHNAKLRGQDLLSKSIGRWKHWNGTDDYLKPKMFDRWRRFVHFRKIVKHWLDFMTNRQLHVKADLSHSFNKWKFFFSDKQNLLQKRTRAQLLSRAVKAAKRLETLADSTQQDEDMVNHISDQNEELFANYRKSQKLALAMGRDNHKMAMMKALKVMQDATHARKVQRMQDLLNKNVGAIAGAKDKMQEIEKDNEALANENEELRQFSLDGYQLGKNVQNLTVERENLSVDLADKANTIKKLLDENERLSVSLRQVQDSAIQLKQIQARA